MVLYTSIRNIPAKVWIYSFFAVNLHLRHHMTFHECINNISPAVKKGETAYFLNHEGSYYDAMSYFWKNMSAPV